MKTLSSLALAACLLGGAPVFAQSAPSVLHPVLQTALDRTQRVSAEDDWRFLVTMTSADGVMVGRFDGTQAQGEEWELVTPATDELSELQAGMWSGLQEPDEDEADDNGLFFSVEDSDILTDTLSLDDEDAARLVFGFQPDLSGEDMAMAEHVRGALTVSRDPVAVTRVRLWAPESFKPHFAVRLNSFELVQEYAHLDGLPAPVLVRVSQEISGRAAFQPFEQSFELAFSEIEYLPATGGGEE